MNGRNVQLTTVSGTSSPQTVLSRYLKGKQLRATSPQAFRSGSVIIQRTPVREYRRGASAELFNDSMSHTFHSKLTSRFGKSWKPRTNAAARSCKDKALESLRDDLVQSSRARGVVHNTKITEEEATEFRHCYSLLQCRQQDPGLSPKLLVRYLLECKIFPGKKDAVCFCRTLPGRKGLYISADVLVASTSCADFRQRGRALRFVKLLPSSDLIRQLRGLSSDWSYAEGEMHVSEGPQRCVCR